MKKIIIIFLTLIFKYSNAQLWLPIGPDEITRPSVSYTDFTNMAIDNNGIPHISYVEELSDGYKLTAKKFNNPNWILLGEQGISTERAFNSTFEFIGDTVYMAYIEKAGSGILGRAVVKKFDGNKWVSLPNVGLSSMNSEVSLCNDLGVLYVAYQDNEYSNKITVKKFHSGQWEVVGSPGFSLNTATDIKLKIDNGIPYVAFTHRINNISTWAVQKYNGTNWISLTPSFTLQTQHLSFTINNHKPYLFLKTSVGISIKQFDGTSWSDIPTSGLNDQYFIYPTIYFNRDIMYVSYAKSGQYPIYKNRAVLMKYNGVSWIKVGEDISMSETTHPSLAFYNDEPYIGYKDVGYQSKMVIKKYNGSKWEFVGREAITDTTTNDITITSHNNEKYIAYSTEKAYLKKYDGENWMTLANSASSSKAYGVSLALKDNIPYLCFIELVNFTSYKLFVKKLDGNSWINVGETGFPANYLCNTSIEIFDDVIYVAYSDALNSNKITVKKFNNSNWIDVGASGFSDGSISYLNMKSNPTDLYVCYQDAGIQSKAIMKKFNGTDWINIGASVTSNKANYLSIAFNNNTPYVAYQDVSGLSQGFVRRYNGTSWELIGGAFSKWKASEIAIAINQGIPYVFFRDEYQNNRGTVVKLDELGWKIVGQSGLSLGSISSSSITTDDSSILISYDNTGAYVKRFYFDETLSIKLKNFKAINTTSSVRLTWSIDYEAKNMKFDIERSDNGKTWQVLGMKLGQGELQEYIFVDKNPLLGVNYYRIVQHESGGQMSYSNIIYSNFNLLKNNIVVYPNPFTNKLNLNINSVGTNKYVIIKLFNLSGELVENSYFLINNSIIEFVPKNILKPGVYLIDIKGEQINYSQKVIIE